MKNIYFIIFSVFLAIGCTQNRLTNAETAKKYFNSRNSVDFNTVENLISDSLTVIEGDYVMHYSPSSFYEVFKWDSVFQTTYKIVDIREANDDIIASVSLSSIRNKFLENDNMTCQFKLSFNSGLISKIESLDCKNVNWEVWSKRVNLLVNWVDANHPELNGFIHDMTLDGAKNYVKVIHLFEANIKMK